MGVDALDLVDRLSGQRRETELDRHDDLADDDEVVLEQQVVVLADRPVDEVLDRQDAGDRTPPDDCLEHLAEAAHAERDRIDEVRLHRVVSEGAGLPREGDRGPRAPGAVDRLFGDRFDRPVLPDRHGSRLNHAVVSRLPSCSSSWARSGTPIVP